MNVQTLHEISRDGFSLIRDAVDAATVRRLRQAWDDAFESEAGNERARSSGGHVYAARNLLGVVPEIRTFWTKEVLLGTLSEILGGQFGLVRVLFFDKPPDRSWSLPWHKDTAIAVSDHSRASASFTRPTVKAGVPHVIASDTILRQMLTLRLHLDDVTAENGPLRVIPGSHLSSTSGGEGVEHAVAIHASAGDVLAMRPLISHASSSSHSGTTLHRRILHLEFAANRKLPDDYKWHDFVSAPSVTDPACR